MAESTTLDWKPQPKQELALSQSAFEILYGGARGGGKTDAGMAFLLYHKHNPLYRALVIRRNADDLKDWADRAERFYARAGAIRRGNPAEFVFPSGAIIRTGHLKDQNAYRKYQGHEYQNLLVEELNHIPNETNYLMLLGSCRSTIADIPAQVFSTTNPDGPGHNWVKERWRIPDEPADDPVTTKDPKSGRWRVFIPATVEDNPKLMQADPGYINYLDSLPDGLREQWRRGSWADFDIEGAYYTNEIRQLIRENRYRFVPHDPMLRVHTVWDLGISAGNEMSVGLFQAISTELRLIGYYENESYGMPHYFAKLQDWQRENGYVYGKHFGPHDLNVRELSTGKTRYQLAYESGWKFDIVPSVPIADGIEQVRIVFPKLWINTENGGKDFMNAIRQYHREFDAKRMAHKGQPYHDWSSNAADMLRYAALSHKLMTNSTKQKYRQKPYQATSPYEGGARSGEDSIF